MRWIFDCAEPSPHSFSIRDDWQCDVRRPGPVMKNRLCRSVQCDICCDGIPGIRVWPEQGSITARYFEPDFMPGQERVCYREDVYPVLLDLARRQKILVIKAVPVARSQY